MYVRKRRGMCCTQRLLSYGVSAGNLAVDSFLSEPMESKLQLPADAGRGFSQTSLIARWSESGNHLFGDESSQLDLEEDILSVVDSSPELASFELDRISGPSSGRQSAVPMFALVAGGAPLPDSSAASNNSLLDCGGELDASLMSTLMQSSEVQQPVSLQQLLQHLDSMIKLDPHETQLSADYIAKILMPTAFDQQMATPTIMTPAVRGPISSVCFGVPEIMPGPSQGNAMLQPPSLVLVDGIPSPDSLPPTPYVPPHALPPLSSILPSDYPHQMFPLLSAEQTANVSSNKSRRPSEKKRNRSDSSCSLSGCSEDGPVVKKAKGGGRSGQLKFKKTENQLMVLRTYFSINKMPSRCVCEA